MTTNNQISQFDRPTQVFRGIRFVLVGFDPTNKAQVLRKLVDGGGVDTGQYGSSCTHVIVDKLAYDEPLCVAARRDGKILVSGIWVDHSFDVGVTVDTTSVMYRPMKDLNGIPGAQSLVICLTGYQRQDREDIMTMVALMGAKFSKPLIANKVTHLICYKFEGEKYILAKKMQRIKLINHRWLEDCLKAWEIISEAEYCKSGYELEMEAEAKDSEDEAEGFPTVSPHRSLAVKQEASGSLLNTPASKGKTASPHHSLVLKHEISGNVSNTSASKGFGNAENTTYEFSNPHEIKSNKPVVLGVIEPSSLFEGTASGSVTENNVKSPNEAKKAVSASYSRKVPMKTTPSTSTLDKLNNISGTKRPVKLNLSDPFDIPFSLVESTNDWTSRSSGLKTPVKGPGFYSEKEKSGSFSGKRKMEDSCGNSKLQRTIHDEETPVRESPQVESAFGDSKDGPAETSNHPSPGSDIPCFNDNIARKKSLSSNCKSAIPVSKTFVSEIAQGEDLDAAKTPLKEFTKTALETKVDSGDVLQNGIQGVEKSSSAALSLDIEKPVERNGESSSKPVKRKSVGKKILASYQSIGKTKTASQKGSIFLKNSESRHDPVEVPGLADDENFVNEKFEKVPPVAKLDTQIETETYDETEPPEDKEKQEDVEPEKTVDVVIEEKTEGDQSNDKDEDITECENLVNDKTSRGKKLPQTKKDKKKTHLSAKEATNKNSEKQEDVEPEKTFDIAIEEKTEGDQCNDKDEDKTGSNENENLVNDKTSRGKKLPLTKKAKKKTPVSAKEVTNKTDKNNENPENRKESAQLQTGNTKRNEDFNDLENAMEVEPPLTKKAKKKPLLSAKESTNKTDKNNENPENRKESAQLQTGKTKRNEDFNDLENAMEVVLFPTKKAKKKTLLSAKEVTNKNDKNNENPENREESTPLQTGKTKRNEDFNDLENAMEVERNNGEKDDERTKLGNSADAENLVNQKATKTNKRKAGKAKKDNVLSVKEVTDHKKGKPTSSKAVKERDLENSMEAQKENMQVPVDDQSGGKSASELAKKITVKSVTSVTSVKSEKASLDPMWFILSGHKLQRREFQQIIRRLKGRVCRVSHQWSYQATHFIVPDPIRRTEKFFAAAASGRWILKTDYLSASNQAGKFVTEEPYEWHKNCLSEDGQINLEAPRKWRLLKQKTGHGAFYGMRIVIYGECIAPPLDTLKRAIKAGDGTILATSPPYTRFLDTNIDFAIVSPGTPGGDIWVQEFIKHEVPCVSADYLVEYVCKPGYPLEKHVQYDTNTWAEKSYNNLKNRSEEEINEPRTPDSNDIPCEVCGSRDRGEEMMICGDESGSTGCGVGTHIDCCKPPLTDVPEEDWFCSRCKKENKRKTSNGTVKKSGKRKGK